MSIAVKKKPKTLLYRGKVKKLNPHMARVRVVLLPCRYRMEGCK